MLANFQWPEPEDTVERKVIRDVRQHKCHLIAVPGDEDGPGFVFSIGLFLNFGHPEFVILGLDLEVGGVAINGLGASIQEGRRFQHGDVLDEVFRNVCVKLVAVDRRFYPDYLGTALWFYRSIQGEFPVLQLVWPDAARNFPWDAEFDEQLHDLQPVLGPAP